MEWMQTYTIVSTTLGVCFFLYLITSRIIDRMESFHRENMKRMDEKWERLFENVKLLIKERGNGG